MATYPIKMLKDEQKQPFVPFTTADCVAEKGGTTLQDLFDNGKYKIQNNVTTASAGKGVLDAYQGKVLNDKFNNYVPTSQKGKPNGVATLDGEGKVPSAQLPSYVDDVLETYIRTGTTALAADWLSLTNGGAALTPEKGKIYVVMSAGSYQNKQYRWGGSTYVLCNPSDVNSVNGMTGVVTLKSLTIQKNGTKVGDTFNGSVDKTINITVPTNNNELTNGAGYITAADNITGNAATATNATNDSDGNKINTTYLKKSQTNITKASGGTLGTITLDQKSTDYINVTKITTATDMDTIKTTGVYIVAVSGCTHTPTGAWGTMYVDWSVGTHYQLYIQDGGTPLIYKRGWNGSAWGNWTKLNSGSADKLATARTITLGDDLTGSASFDGSANITINTRRRGASVGQNTSTNTNPWYKVASCVASATYEDRWIVFLVDGGYSDSQRRIGILRAHFRTGSNKLWEDGNLYWASVTSAINPNDFVLAYKNDTASVTAELWCKCPYAYNGYHFDVLGEGNRVNRTFRPWVLYNTWSAGSQASLPEGYTTKNSVILTLSNSISGNAASATKATQDGNGKVISDTYETKANAITGLSISGKTITYTKGNGTTGTLTTQDSVYTLPKASATVLGGVKVGLGLAIDANGILTATGEETTIDSALSTTSGNAVQNKVISPILMGISKDINNLDLNTLTDKVYIGYGYGNTHAPVYDASSNPVSGYTMSIARRDNNNYTFQLSIPNDSNSLYIRQRVNGTWKPWARLAMVNELNSYLPLSGGTMTGVITTKTGQGIQLSNNSYISNTTNDTLLGFIDGATILGSYNGQTSIRSSSDDLYHFNNALGTSHKILDTNNFRAQYGNVLRMYSRLDLTSLDNTKFYPITFSNRHYMLDCEIHSEGGNGTKPYNSNFIHFQLVSQGWTDTPQSLVVLGYNKFDGNEITIGCIGRGTKHGDNVIWLRGGLVYYCYLNDQPKIHTTDFNSNPGQQSNEIFTVGASVSGGTNTNVEIIFSPNTTSRGSYFRDKVAINGMVSVISQDVGQIQLRYGAEGKGSYIRNDGQSTYILVSDTNTGGYNTLRPFRVNNTSGLVSMDNGVMSGSSTDATSVSTGSLIVKGGTGIAKKLHVGSDITTDSGKVNFTSNAHIVYNSSNMCLEFNFE